MSAMLIGLRACYPCVTGCLRFIGWMIGVLQPFQHHRSFGARLLMKGNDDMEEAPLEHPELT